MKVTQLVLSVDPLIQEATYECRSTSGRDRPRKLREWMCDCQHIIKRMRGEF